MEFPLKFMSNKLHGEMEKSNNGIVSDPMVGHNKNLAIVSAYTHYRHAHHVS